MMEHAHSQTRMHACTQIHTNINTYGQTYKHADMHSHKKQSDRYMHIQAQQTNI